MPDVSDVGKNLLQNTQIKTAVSHQHFFPADDIEIDGFFV